MSDAPGAKLVRHERDRAAVARVGAMRATKELIMRSARRACWCSGRARGTDGGGDEPSKVFSAAARRAARG